MKCSSLVVSQDETKRHIQLKHCGLVSKNVIQMSDKFLRLERGQAVILPVQEPVLAAKTSAYLMPVVAVFGNETLLCFREIGDRSWPLTKAGSDFLHRIGLWIGSDSGSDRIGLRIGSDWQFALNSHQNGHVTSPGMKMAERKVRIQSSVTNLVFLFFFLL